MFHCAIPHPFYWVMPGRNLCNPRLNLGIEYRGFLRVAILLVFLKNLFKMLGGSLNLNSCRLSVENFVDIFQANRTTCQNYSSANCEDRASGQKVLRGERELASWRSQSSVCCLVTYSWLSDCITRCWLMRVFPTCSLSTELLSLTE